jgi:ribosome biogenesis GTPase
MARRKQNRKLRTDFRKNREVRPRDRGLTDQFTRPADRDALDRLVHHERLSGKGEVTRRRTVIGAESDDESSGQAVRPAIDDAVCLPGTVLRAGGLHSEVLGADGRIYRCATRRLLKTLATDQRHVVAAGDRVMFRPAGPSEGLIERVESRYGVLARDSRGRQHVMVANVDQLIIVASAAEPGLKPHLIDRILLTADKAGIRPLICINKADLIEPTDLQPIIGCYSQLGYRTLLISATAQWGIDQLREVVVGRANAVVGQSGVGKSSVLNAIEPGLDLKVRAVSADNEKGRHTTTAAQLVPLEAGGFVVDTPGIRQFVLWDVVRAEVASLFRDIRPLANRCAFPDCTHTHEAQCAVKDAVADGLLDVRRYESYCHMQEELQS